MSRHNVEPLFIMTAALVFGTACGSDSEDDNEAMAGSGGTATGGTAGGGGAATGGVGSGGIQGGGGSGGVNPMTGGGPPVTGGAGGVGGMSGAGGSGGSPIPVGCRAPVPDPSPGNTCSGTPPPALQLTEITPGLNVPVFLTHAPGDMDTLYVLEREGTIRTITNGTLDATPFLDIQSTVEGPGPAGEQGLLGLAFDPNYQDTGRFWVYYTVAGGENAVASFTGTPGQPANASSGGILIQVEHISFAGNHNGGMIAFGPDGCLFVAVGDGGGANDPEGRGQDVSDALGSILRLDLDNYPTPAPGNMTGANVFPHLWDYGLRNPWRFSFDRVTGDLYIGDVGQGDWEEIDVEPAGTGQRNYGWNVMEGDHCFGGGTTCDQTGMTRPADERPNPPNEAVIGGYVYRGSNIPGMVGRYVYGDHASRDIWTFTWSGESGGVPEICDEYELTGLTPGGNITSFGEDAAGELYVVTMNGVVYRIDPQ